MDWYLGVLKQYAVFDGRARRKAYWMFVLFNFAIAAALGVVGRVIGLGGALQALYSLGILIPGLAVSVRRLHDTGRSGWMLLIALIPFVGWLVVLYFLVQPGETAANNYGPDPKAEPGPDQRATSNLPVNPT
jgi:uncharacterized membrane protein YhaH (DUF805 family)